MKQIEQRAYQLFEGQGRSDGHDLEGWFKVEQELLKRSGLDIREKDNTLHVRAELPGFQLEELEINLDPRHLTIKGSRKEESEKKDKRTYHSEKQARQVFRKLSLPATVVPEKAKATLKDGVLEIMAPKAEENKRIEIKAA